MSVNYRKAQVFISDILMSIIIFVVVIGISMSLINRAWEKRTRFDGARYHEQRSFEVSDLMVRSSGYPENWNSSNVRIVGLAEPSHVIQNSSIQELDSTSNERLRKIWQLPYDTNFYINISAGNYSWQKGQKWGDNADLVIPSRRAIIYNSTKTFERGTLNFVLWR